MRAQLAILVVLCVGCPQSHRMLRYLDVADSGVDDGTDVDTDWEREVDSGVDTGVDTGADSDADCDDPRDDCCGIDNCIDVGDLGIPPCSDIGAECRDNRDCQLGFSCLTEAQGWPGGYCIAGGPVGGGGCDPDLPASCPVGSKCVYDGRDAEGAGYYYCYKSCVISDRNPWDQSACGCRDGYQCDLVHEVCVPGCAAARVDDDCCRHPSFTPDPFFPREPEWKEIPGCTFTCNEDAFRCVNPGDPEAEWGDPCVYAQDCPEEGICLPEHDADGDPETDLHLFVGGYCTRLACNLPGRRCGGDCRDLGSPDDPIWGCAKGCEVAADGADPWAVNVTCGADYRCFPDPDDPEAEENGYCWPPPNYNDVRERNTGGPCEEDADCYSPFGQGLCFAEEDGRGWLGGTCALAACDFPGMEDECPGPGLVCEPMGETGVCLDRCWAPEGGHGVEVGCRDDDYACYASGVGGDVGVCLPNCTAQPDPDRFCRKFFVGAPNCHEDTGTCGI